FAFLGRAVTTVLLGHAVLLIRTAPRSKSSAQAVQPEGRTPPFLKKDRTIKPWDQTAMLTKSPVSSGFPTDWLSEIRQVVDGGPADMVSPLLQGSSRPRSFLHILMCCQERPSKECQDREL
ncbi:hypothetical protein, partial [Paracoccus rhizosphaerae]|uniref:hypothetical protein n=1 Tax=Paracoccus rhizosphaerae TaxID=1133347 RepID=UPI00223FFBDA